MNSSLSLMSAPSASLSPSLVGSVYSVALTISLAASSGCGQDEFHVVGGPGARRYGEAGEVGSCLRAKRGPRPVRGGRGGRGLASGEDRGLIMYERAGKVGVLPRAKTGASSCTVGQGR